MIDNQTDFLARACTAFNGHHRFAGGALIDVALAIKAGQAEAAATTIYVFDDVTGRLVDIDLRGGTADIIARLRQQAPKMLERAQESAQRQQPADGSADPVRGPGRPKLGVVAREVTLLPRHWDWLAAQPGGASQALRRLVDAARRADGGTTDNRTAREAAYRFLSALAGDLPGYEEAMRALFAGDGASFAGYMAAWPADIRDHGLKLAGLSAA